MNHQASIEIQGLSTGYITSKRRVVIADKIDATIRAGELTCLLGANGAGKSTLLRTLSGFQPPLGGEIRLMGRPLGEYSDKRLSRVIGVVLTDKCEIRNMSVARSASRTGRSSARLSSTLRSAISPTA